MNYINSPRILIVEDQNIVAMDIQNRLRNLNYTVVGIASSGAGAIKKADETIPDLVLMDIMLKGDMDGIGAARQIRLRFNIPVVYLTAYADTDTLQRAKITEPFGYILKPFEERELHTTIEMALYRHKMEKQLKEREQWFATTLKSIGDGVITTDKNGFVTFLNPVAEILTGWKQTEVLNKPLKEVFNIIDLDTREPVEDPALKAIEQGSVIFLPDKTILISKDETEKIIADSAAPIKNEDSEIIGVVIIFRDITDKKRMEKELQKIQKLESIGILAGGIAHDFNNILTAIVGNISLAKMKVTEEDRIYDLLNEAESASFHAKDLTQQLLTFSKGGSPIKKVMCIKNIIEKSVKFSLTGSNVKYQFNIAPDLWSVEVDEGQFTQVINNLVINADQSMPQGGILEIKAENIPEHQIRKNSMLPLKITNYVCIKITDHGIGVPEKNLAKIFDPYFTTKQKGSGLGLTISFSIIAKHDGLITVDSKLGEGTSFYVYLPVNKAHHISGEPKQPEIERGVGKILVMDDEPMLLTLADKMLSDLGYKVQLSKDGREALKNYKAAMESGENFDLVLMDLTIPGGMGGKEAITELLKIDPKAKVIVCSGYSNDPIISNYQEYGFSNALTKPFRFRELSKVISNVMNN